LRGTQGMDMRLQDLRFGARMLVKNPGFTAVAVLILALGIGANSAIFSVVNGVLLRPLPYHEPERLALIRISLEGQEFLPSVSPPEVMDFREQTKLFAGVAAIRDNTAAITGSGDPEQIQIGNVTANFLPLLGVHPALGRSLNTEDDLPGASPVVLISYELWQRRFGGSPKVVGSTIQLNGQATTVAGVLPQGLRLLLARQAGLPTVLDAWQPFGFDFRSLQRDFRWVRAVVRLQPGVSLKQAEEGMNALAGELLHHHSEYGGIAFQFHVEPLQGDLVREIRPALLALLGAVGFVLLIASANAANLLLLHAAGRERELAIRASVGATRGRLARQLLSESALLALLGAATGFMLAQWAVDLLKLLAPPSIPRLQDVVVDGTALLFTLVVGLLLVFAVGWMPAWTASRAQPNAVLKEGGRSSGGSARQRLRSVLVVSEIALCMILLIGAGLMVRSFLRLQRADPGFRPARVLSINLSMPFGRYPSQDKLLHFLEKLASRIEALPGAESVGGVFPLPLSGRFWTAEYAFDDESEQRWGTLSADQHSVTPGYFEAVAARLHEGRFFTWADVMENRPVVVVDDMLADAVWPGESAVGMKLKVLLPNNRREWLKVIGVVEHMRKDHPGTEGREQIYLPLHQWPYWSLPLVIRSSTEPASLLRAVEKEVRFLDKDLPVYRVRTLEDYLAESTVNNRFTMVLMGVFAGIALILASVGLYSVVAYSIAQRTHEIGIRMALGARRIEIFRLVMAEGMVLTMVGIAIGLAGSLALTRVLDSLLFGVGSTDPGTLAGVALLLAAVSLAACYMPARRATRVPPMTALRRE
ncbi:MAG: ABC transporter permease, partial [Acidobacteriota bacterium]